jgi:hypothetical protein
VELTPDTANWGLITLLDGRDPPLDSCFSGGIVSAKIRAKPRIERYGQGLRLYNDQHFRTELELGFAASVSFRRGRWGADFLRLQKL